MAETPKGIDLGAVDLRRPGPELSAATLRLIARIIDASGQQQCQLAVMMTELAERFEQRPTPEPRP